MGKDYPSRVVGLGEMMWHAVEMTSSVVGELGEAGTLLLELGDRVVGRGE